MGAQKGRGRPESELTPTTAEERFGAQLRQLRHIHGSTLAELGVEVGCSAATLGQAERGRSLPGEALVRELDATLHADRLLVGLWEDAGAERRQRALARSPRTSRTRRETPEGGFPIAGDSSEWVDDITVPDGTLMAPGERFTKVWRLRNSGTVVWRDRYLMRRGVLGSSGQVSTNRLSPIAVTQPGEEVDIAVACKAHVLGGTSVAHFKMADRHHNLFYPDTNPEGIILSICVIEDMEPRAKPL